ncbi:globin [Bacteriovoracaceae bacterium]|nr:globin [Bacteriovoracaceae bacterium]
MDTDLEHQNKAIIQGLEIIIRYLDDEDKYNKQQIMRIAKSHNHYNLDIHPHSYYYWIEALILTIKKFDSQWFDDLEYYWRECVSVPINFITSQFFVQDSLSK